MTNDPSALRPLVEAGHRLIPLRQGDKPPLHSGWRTRPYTTEEILGYAERGYNVGVALGELDLLIDYDPRHDPDGDSLWLLEQTFDGVADAPRVLTGGGGVHIYLRKPAGVRIRKNAKDDAGVDLFPGVDFKTLGTYVVAPGSLHPSGRLYEWERQGDAPEVPAALLALLKREGPAAAAGPREPGEVTPAGLREMLGALDVEDFQEHDGWLELMMACHHAVGGDPEGREVFVEWSTSDPLYADHSEVIRDRWDSLRSDGAGGAVTVATLRKRVTAAGGAWDPDPEGYECAEDFEALAEQDAEELAALGLGGSAEKPKEPAWLRRMRWLNEHYRVVNIGGATRVMALRPTPCWHNPGRSRDIWTAMAVRDFENWMERYTVVAPDARARGRNAGDWVPQNAGRVWLRWPERREVSRVEFTPGRRTPDDVLNTWEGWGVDGRPGDWSRTRAYIEEVVADGDEEHAHYILNWIAWMFQRPCELPGTALVLVGGKGTGKSFLGETVLRPIVGDGHTVPVSRPEHLTGSFNGHFRDALLVLAEEAVWGGSKKDSGPLKELVTQPLVSYNAKYQPSVVGPNRCHLILTSNEERVVDATEGERRWAVFRASNRHRQDRAYFGRVAAELRAGGWEAMFWDLSMEWDVTHPAESLPQTEALGEQILANLSPMERWWMRMLESGGLADDPADWERGPVSVSVDWLRELAAGYLDARERGRMTNDRVGVFLRDLDIPGARHDRVRTGAGADHGGTARVRQWTFPEISICRSAWEQRIGISIDW